MAAQLAQDRRALLKHVLLVGSSPRCYILLHDDPNGPWPAASRHRPLYRRRRRHRLSLQDVQSRGRAVLLPVGCSDYDQWLLDALSVDRVLKQLRAGTGTLDLINACVSSSTSAAAAPSRRETLLGTPPRGHSSNMDEASAAAIADFRGLGLGSGGTPGGAAAGESADGGGGVDPAEAALPQLRLKSLQVGASLWYTGRAPRGGKNSVHTHACAIRFNSAALLAARSPACECRARLPALPCPPPAAGLQEYQLKELAYAIFLSCCGAQASPALLGTLRASLELSEARAAELQRITTLVGRQGVTSLATLEMHVKLLQVGRQRRWRWRRDEAGRRSGASAWLYACLPAFSASGSIVCQQSCTAVRGGALWVVLYQRGADRDRPPLTTLSS